MGLCLPFFHGDHASTFVTGSYLRGIRDFDVQAAYELLLNNAFVEGSGKGPMGGGDVSLKNIWSKDGFRKMILRTLNWKL